MSIINIRQTTNITAALAYQDGKDGDRAVYKTSSCDPIEFLDAAKSLIPSRCSVEALTLVQSFSSKELDCTNPADVLKAHQSGIELCARLNEEFHIMFEVNTHVDGKGHCIHNHIDIPNVDLETGKALQGRIKLWQYLTFVNDSVMKDMDLEVCNTSKQPNYDFKKDLENRIIGAMSVSDSYNEFVLNAAKMGVVVDDKKANGYYKKHITYVFKDGDGVTHKVRDYKFDADYSRDAITREVLKPKVKLDESLAPRQQQYDDYDYNF